MKDQRKADEEGDVLFRVRLKNLIEAMGVTDFRFAELTGMTPAGLSQILSGKREPGFKTLQKIHMNTGADIQHLMGQRIGERDK